LVPKRVFYGWVVVLTAAAAMVGTLPGRSQGLGLITEPLLADFADAGLDRVRYAGINFWATLAGALGALGIGKMIDRAGARVVLVVVSLLLAVTVALMSQVSSILALAITLAATRAIGQGALSVVSIAMVGHWFRRRINAAMATYSIVLSIGFMLAFPVVGSAVQAWGWRRAWLWVAIALGAGLAPIAWLVVRRGPETIGLLPDGDTTTEQAASGTQADVETPGYRVSEALATGAFWVFGIGAALYGLVASGIGLFNESILAERGFNHDVYYQSLVVTAMTGLAGNFLGGWMTTERGAGVPAGKAKMPLTRLMAAALFVLAAGVAALPHLSSLTHVMTWAAAMGLGGGVMMVLFFSAWPRVFGRKNLGQIQGIAQALTVLASAIGPLLLAWCVSATGSYAAMFRLLAIVIAFTSLASLVVVVPKAAQS
jgi:MFS family permease